MTYIIYIVFLIRRQKTQEIWKKSDFCSLSPYTWTMQEPGSSKPKWNGTLIFNSNLKISRQSPQNKIGRACCQVVSHKILTLWKICLRKPLWPLCTYFFVCLKENETYEWSLQQQNLWWPKMVVCIIQDMVLYKYINILGLLPHFFFLPKQCYTFYCLFVLLKYCS